MFLSRLDLLDLGFAEVGDDVMLDAAAIVIGAPYIHVGSHVRIDAHCLITAGPGYVRIGDHVHVSAAAHVFGAGAGVDIGDFGSLSSRASVFSATDDYSEGHLTNPTVPDSLRKVHAAPVSLGEHVIVGCGSVLLPGVRLERGASVGALSLVTRSVPEYAVMAGSPARRIGTRDGERLGRLEARLRTGDVEA